MKSKAGEQGILFAWDDAWTWGNSPDCQAAHKEGWDLFLHTGRGDLEIEAITDLEEVGCTDPIGVGDDVVVAEILKRAGRGSRMHMLAIYLDGRPLRRGSDIWIPKSLLHPAVLKHFKEQEHG